MAVALRATASNASGASSSTTTLVINKPAGTAVGDLLLANLGGNLGTGSAFTLAGWNIVPNFTGQSQGSNTLQNLLYRIADGTEGSTFTFSVASSHNAGNIAAYSGVDPNNPFAGLVEATGTASTTATFPTANPQSESAYGVLCLVDGNTTASGTTPSAPSGYTRSAQAGSGQTRYIEAAIFDSHTAYGLPLTAVSPGNSTLNNSSAKGTVTLFLRPIVSNTGFDVDVAMNNIIASTTSAVSDAFATGYNDEVIIVQATGESANSVSTQTLSNTLGLTFTKLLTSSASLGSDQVSIWYAHAPTPTSGKITITNSLAQATEITVYSILNMDTTTMIGASNSAGAFTGAATVSLTTTVNGSWVYGGASRNSTTAPTVGTAQTMLSNAQGTSNRSYFQRQNAVTTTSGTSVTINDTAPTTGAWDMYAIELLPPSSSFPGSKTQTAVARIAVNLTKTQPAVARIAVTVTKTQTATARISNNFTKTQGAIARIANSGTKTQTAKARIAVTVTKTQSAVARIANSRTLTQSATARIGQTGTKTQGAIARIANVRTLTQSATARIQRVVTKTQPATAMIAVGLSKTQSATARIGQTATKTQTAIARVAVNLTRTQTATARIQRVVTRTQPAVARIAVTVTKTQTAVARIANNFTKTQTAKARIGQTGTKTQGATARIAVVASKTQTAKARIAVALTKTQTATARVATKLTKTQTATARIGQTGTKTQTAIARISASRTKTQTATARLAVKLTKTQTATAYIYQTVQATPITLPGLRLVNTTVSLRAGVTSESLHLLPTTVRLSQSGTTVSLSQKSTTTTALRLASPSVTLVEK